DRAAPGEALLAVLQGRAGAAAARDHAHAARARDPLRRGQGALQRRGGRGGAPRPAHGAHAPRAHLRQAGRDGARGRSARGAQARVDRAVIRSLVFSLWSLALVAGNALAKDQGPKAKDQLVGGRNYLALVDAGGARVAVHRYAAAGTRVGPPVLLLPELGF